MIITEVHRTCCDLQLPSISVDGTDKMNFERGAHMEKKSKNMFTLIGIITVVVAIASTVAMILYKCQKKRKDDEELEHYIETAIM